MGGGDLNMKKSWHPVLLVNQERVWKAEKVANEEKKIIAQLRKEREEERQLEELHRLQEASTGKKRVDKLDWMYAAPSNEGGALGGARIGEKDMEEYLLGKKRVDEALAQGDRDVGASSREFIAVQNANTARDTAAKIREDPLLAIKKQEQAALAALMNRPDVRKQMREAQKAREAKEKGEIETKEERKARRKLEKEERRKHKHRHSRRDRDSRSPVSDYSGDKERSLKRTRHDSHDSRDRYQEDRHYSHRDQPRSISPRRERDYRIRDTGLKKEYMDEDSSRSLHVRKVYREESPRRDVTVKRDYRDESSRRDVVNKREYRGNSPRRDVAVKRERRDESPRRESRRDDEEKEYRRDDRRDRDRERDDRIPPPRDYSRPAPPPINSGNGRAPLPLSRPSASSAPVMSAANNTGVKSLDDQRAARLAAMSASAETLYSQRSKTLAQRAEEEKREFEKEERMRAKYGQEHASAGFFSQQGQGSMGLGETLQRRGGKGLLKDI